MKIKQQGQSLIDMVFSMGVVILVLTGVVVLMVSISRIKTLTLEREKATELSQKVMENEIKSIKSDPLAFWTSDKFSVVNQSGASVGYSGFTYDKNYSKGASVGCLASSDPNEYCNVNITVKWDKFSVSINRSFSRQGL